MSLFPKIQSPCPYKGKLSDIMDGSQCRLCQKEVVDLTEMATAERKALLNSSKDEICVSYSVSAKSALAAVAMGAAAIPTAAAAQANEATDSGEEVEDQNFDFEEMMIIVGGMRKPQSAMWMSDTPTITVPQPALDKEPAADETSQEVPENLDGQGIVIVAGGMRKPQEAEWVSEEKSVEEDDASSPLPVEYDEETPAS